MSEMIKNQKFGTEIEMTGIARETAARIVSKLFWGTENRIGHESAYDTYYAIDQSGRKWKFMNDASIDAYGPKAANGHRTHYGTGRSRYSTEFVTPICTYEDLETIQQIIRELVAAGAYANTSCGMHVHVDGANHSADSMKRLENFFVGRQDLFYEALEIGSRADRWCQKSSDSFFKAIRKTENITELETVWYSFANDGYCGGIDHSHYNQTRYHGLNLHAYFTKGTIEFRLFNGTTHAGKIKAYIQFCLAMSGWAIECDHDNLFFKSVAGYTAEQKKNIMLRVLRNRLGMKGEEFRIAREHLTAVFTA